MRSKGRVKSIVGRTFVRDGGWLHKVDDNAGLWKLGWTRRIREAGSKWLTGVGGQVGDLEVSLRLKMMPVWHF